MERVYFFLLLERGVHDLEVKRSIQMKIRFDFFLRQNPQRVKDRNREQKFGAQLHDPHSKLEMNGD